jgi:undecaprenyl diphosphate synthase
MDGNGRWAKMRNLPRIFGHRQGVKTVKKIVQAAGSLGIEVLTLYAFSSENWKRPESEIKGLLALLSKFISKELKELNEKGIKLRILGDLSKFPPKTISEVSNACKTTSKNKGLQLNIALNYGARQELISAFTQMQQKGIKNPSEAVVSSFLYTKNQPDPDLVIRTSGQLRLSNFLLWQIAYAEIHITPKFWPEFTEEDLKFAIEEFKKRERRFGGLEDESK